MYCKNCGNQLNDGAVFCEKCGAPQFDQANYWDQSQPRMTKKEYFNSEIASPKSKKLKTANWVIFIAHTVIILAMLLLMIFSIFALSSAIDTAEEKIETDKYFSKLLDEEGFDKSALAELGIDAEVPGIFEMIMKTVVIVWGVYSLVTIALAFFAVYKRSVVVSVISVVVTFTFGGIIILLGTTAAMLILNVIMDKEYKQYYFYGTNNNFF